MKPLLKWAGGKEQELKYIIPNMPENFRNYYEPFVGGGAVYMAVDAEEYFINDKSDELIGLYNIIRNNDRDEFFEILNDIADNWDIIQRYVTVERAANFKTIYKDYSCGNIEDKEFRITISDIIDRDMGALLEIGDERFIKEIHKNLIRKTTRMKVIESTRNILPDDQILDNIETALKSAYYMYFRQIYNSRPDDNALRSAVFLFIRNFTYSGMFRYNSQGEFNVPYGGIGYNRKNFRKKIEYLQSDALRDRLTDTTIENLDFEAFMRLHTPAENDFIFLDPPYDSQFSTYAQNSFTQDDQRRLADYLTENCRARWMMIIKNTDFIYSLYRDRGLNIDAFEKKYLVSFMNRNDKDVEHLMIRNYR